MTALAPRVGPRLSVVVATRHAPTTLEQSLASLTAQQHASELEILLADGSEHGELAALAAGLDNAQHVHVPGGNLPRLKGEAMRRASAPLIAILDPTDVAEPDWTAQIFDALSDPSVTAVGGTVLLGGPHDAANVAAYLFEYGAFNPPVDAGPTDGELPGNNLAFRREALDSCADMLATEGFHKPFFQQRVREDGGRLVMRPTMCVRHVTRYHFLDFSRRRFHYARCFGAVRLREADSKRRALYRAFAPTVAPLLMVKHVRRAASHPENRRLLPGAAVALCGVSAFWGVGEWLGYWFGCGGSCEELY